MHRDDGHDARPAGDARAVVEGRAARFSAGRMAAMLGAMLALVAVALASEALGGAVDGRLLAVDLAVGLAGSVLLVARARGGRVPSTVVLVAASAFSPAATPLAATATLWVARWRPLRIAVGVASAGVGALLVRELLRPAGGIAFGWWVLLILAVHAALVGWGAMLRAHHELVASLAERARRVEADQAARLAAARQAERDLLAREMHDVLAHRLSLLATYAGALEYRSDTPPDQVREAAGVIRAAAHQALVDLREVVGILRREERSHGGARRPVETVDQLPALVAECRDAGMTVHVRDELRDTNGLPSVASGTAYRVVQEALTNVRKHAAGSVVDVHLSGGPGAGLTVAVTNSRGGVAGTGTGLPGSRTGLVGLAERVTLAQGRLRHGATADGGYRVETCLPWPP